MAHAIGLAALACIAGCAASQPEITGSLRAIQPDWFYVPGPYRTVQAVGQETRTATVTAETNNTWTVRFGDPPTTILVTRTPDGRPATALIADPARNETVVFDPPLPLVPAPDHAPPAEETASIALYKGLHPQGPPASLKPTRTGSATREFLGVENASWAFQGQAFPAQTLTHMLTLSLSPAQIRQTYRSTAVQSRGIVVEELEERVTVLGIRIGGRQETAQVIEFIDER
ncbi:MAG: hypothetical protein RIB58_03050 [Phycisphaerales bacterium]|jgi:hypothetical protein